MGISSILWRRLDRPGHESARLAQQAPGWELAGTAVFARHGLPCRLDYRILCDSEWHTRSAQVDGWLGHELITAETTADSAHRWRLNGTIVPTVEGCLDVDLNFSPSTNLLPIRRLNLAIGQAGVVTAAWLRFPDFVLEPLEQVYRRVGQDTYRYESAGGQFTADLIVNAAGFVTHYPGLWEAEGFAEGQQG